MLGDAIDHYEEVIPGEQLPDKAPMPLQVHKREGEPCPRCGTTIEAVFFSEHQMNYCPEEQTGGRVLKDRALAAAEVGASPDASTERLEEARPTVLDRTVAGTGSSRLASDRRPPSP